MTAAQKKKLRLRIVGHSRIAGQYFCVAVGSDGKAVEASPAGSFDDCERYRDNYRRYGAWRKS